MPPRLGSTWIAFALAAACAAPVPAATIPDVGPVDAWLDPSGPRGGGGIRLGGSSDAGHDARVVTGGCGARILTIFDRSASMGSPWSSGGATSPRWQVAETALASALEPHASQLVVGAILFPSSDAPPLSGGECAAVDPIGRQIPFAACATFLSTWTATWTTPTLYGSTPIDAAFDAADAALAGAGHETGVVLLTDGEPTCAGATAAATRAAEWHARGIDTWVVGLPGSEAGMAYLAGIASAGGTGAPISVDDPAALGTALAGITTSHVEGQCAP